MTITMVKTTFCVHSRVGSTVSSTQNPEVCIKGNSSLSATRVRCRLWGSRPTFDANILVCGFIVLDVERRWGRENTCPMPNEKPTTPCCQRSSGAETAKRHRLLGTHAETRFGLLRYLKGRNPRLILLPPLFSPSLLRQNLVNRSSI